MTYRKTTSSQNCVIKNITFSLRRCDISLSPLLCCMLFKEDDDMRRTISLFTATMNELCEHKEWLMKSFPISPNRHQHIAFILSLIYVCKDMGKSLYFFPFYTFFFTRFIHSKVCLFTSCSSSFEVLHMCCYAVSIYVKGFFLH